MLKRKVDNRVRILVENGAVKGFRSLFVIVGNKSKDQVVYLHHILSKTGLKQASVLWCYKKKLSLSSHRKKRMKQLQAKQQGGNLNVNEDDPFEMFVSMTNIRYCFYKDTHRILGNTFKMCILQDFEALTPNILCRTIETVEGGGMVVVLLESLASLKQLYTMNMDVHSRYRNQSHQNVVPRFNERFIFSLATCPACLVLNDELQIIPISSLTKEITPVPFSHTDKKLSKNEQKLNVLKESVKDIRPHSVLVSLCKTLDQAQVVTEFISAIMEKSLNTTVTLTASRGRGKSAAMGLALAGALSVGYSNMFVTSPSPENLNTFFEFLLKGINALGYEKHLHYQILTSTDNEHNNAILRLTVNKDHRQIVQYIAPCEHDVLSNAEILIVDEAAAIPLPMVEKLLGPYLVFLASTVSGYEGTGQSLTLRLIKRLRNESEMSKNEKIMSKNEKSVVRRKKCEDLNKNYNFDKIKEKCDVNSDNFSKNVENCDTNKDNFDKISEKSSINSRKLVELSLLESIRYKKGDPVEKWLYDLLVLKTSLPSLEKISKVKCNTDKISDLQKDSDDSAVENLSIDKNFQQNAQKKSKIFQEKFNIDQENKLFENIPEPKDCSLFYVNRDTLFSSHKISERFLKQLISLLSSSYYRNSPDDLQTLSDAPSHHLFVLISSQHTYRSVPLIICVVQVSIEGKFSTQLIEGEDGPSGVQFSSDLIPWTVKTVFEDSDFPRMSCLRIIRIATHPSLQRRGYGTRALNLLENYYRTTCSKASTENLEVPDLPITVEQVDEETLGLLVEKISPETPIHPLLLGLHEREAEPLHYMGVIFGATPTLVNFWKKSKFTCLFLNQNENELTAEHSCLMLKVLCEDSTYKQSETWLRPLWIDFKKRMINLLHGPFKELNAKFASSFINSKLYKIKAELVSFDSLKMFLNENHIKRLDAYCRNQCDFSRARDVFFKSAELYFRNYIPELKFKALHTAILVGVGIQRNLPNIVAQDLELECSTIMTELSIISERMLHSLKCAWEQCEKIDIEAKNTSSLQEVENSNFGANVESRDLQIAAQIEAEVSDELEQFKKKSVNIVQQIDVKQFKIQDADNEEADVQKSGPKKRKSMVERLEMKKKNKR